MKKCIAALLCAVFLLYCAGCTAGPAKDISCQDVIAAYEKAGYEVLHNETTEDWDWVCYVRADDPKSDEYIFFHFFEDADAAESYAETRQWNVALWLYSLASFNPTWLTTKTYGNIEYEYADDSLVKPFEQLIK